MTPELATQVLAYEQEQGDEVASLATAREEECATQTTAPVAAEGPHGELADHPEVAVEQAVVAVVGMGYVGLPTAVALRGAGARIIGIDISPERLEQIRAGRAELLAAEQEELAGYLAEEGFQLTEHAEALAAADLVMVCVPTPVDANRRPDATALRAACAAVVANARAGQTIVLTSTTYVGTTRELLLEPLAARGLQAGRDVFVAFAPERIDPGVADHAQRATPRVIGAVSESCFRRAAALLEHTCERLHRVSSPEAAEMVKLFENTFRAVNIALAFEIAEACRTHGLDAREVIDGAASKPYGFLAHYPSAGVGGHCIGVDPHYLLAPLRERGRPASVAEEAMRKLAGRPRHIVWRAHELLVEEGRSLRGARVLVVGLSYKAGVGDSREAPAIEIIQRLRAEGAEVHFHDPLVPRARIDGETLQGIDPDPRRDPTGFGPEDFDLAILVTVHPGPDYGWLRRCPLVLDCTYSTPGGRRREVP